MYFCLGGALSRPGWRTCPCFTSPNLRVPCRTRRSSSSRSSWISSNREGVRRPAGWRTIAPAVQMAAANCCLFITSRTTRIARTAWRSRPGHRWGASSVAPTSSPPNSLNFARNYSRLFFLLFSFPLFSFRFSKLRTVRLYSKVGLLLFTDA